jgi:hypothetical protein
MKPIRSFVIGAALAVIACVGISLMGQTAAGLMPSPKMQFLDSSGHPLVGGLVYTYAAGTTTPLATYTDSGAGTPNANPVVLDSAGRAGIWLSSAAYKIALKTSAGVAVWTVDNVTAPTLSSTSITIPNAATFTMAAGSISDFSTALLPNASGTYDLGSSGKAWNFAYINHISTNGDFLTSTNNTYDIGTLTTAWQRVHTLTALAHTLKLCGTTTNVLRSNCYAMAATTDGTNTDGYTTLKDDLGAEVWRWSRREGGVDTGIATTSLHVLPAASATYDLGTASKKFRNLNLSGNAVIGGAVTSNQLTISGGSFPVINFGGATLASLGVAVEGIMVYCSDCTVATPCTGAGMGAWAFGVSGGSWNCPF